MARLAKLDVVSIEDLALNEIERIFSLADGFAESLARGESLEIARGLIMATLFYEPSTRTRLSFESAMHRLGGAVISSPDMRMSSAAKGESLADTVRVVSAYADLIVLRHPCDGAARVAAEYAPCSIVNAGDGSLEHPSQTLCDLYVLRRRKGRLKGLTVAICGDLKFGRTVHSLIYALARFGGNIVAVPNAGMEVPEHVLDRIALERNYRLSTVTMEELGSLAGGLDALYLTPDGPHQMALFASDRAVTTLPRQRPPAALDAFYVTRLQRERLPDKNAPAEPYVHFDARALKTSRTHEAVVLHPLPRTEELAYELDSDPRAAYFEQAAAGVPIRMALLAWLIEQGAQREHRTAQQPVMPAFTPVIGPRCANARCISRNEGAYLAAKFYLCRSANPAALGLRCSYCGRQLNVEYVGHSSSRRYYRFEESLAGYVRQWIDESALALFETVKQAEENGYEPYRRGPQREIMNAAQIEGALKSLAAQIIADASDLATVTLAGIVSHGAIMALRLAGHIEAQTGVRPPCLAVDVYGGAGAAARSLDTSEDPDVTQRTVVLVDDVINSGWTVQRAMTVIWGKGRPAAVKLAVLIDRGHRAVPIRPNYVGRNMPTARNERVQVKVALPGEGEARSSDRVVMYSMVDMLGERQAQ